MSSCIAKLLSLQASDSLEITINLLKINFKTLIDLIKDKDEATKTTYKGIDDNENDFETTFLLSARPEGSDKWITFSQGNLLKLKDYVFFPDIAAVAPKNLLRGWNFSFCFTPGRGEGTRVGQALGLRAPGRWGDGAHC